MGIIVIFMGIALWFVAALTVAAAPDPHTQWVIKAVLILFLIGAVLIAAGSIPLML